MAPYAYFTLLVGLVAAGRMTAETEESSNAKASIMKSCETLLGVYNNAKTKVEESVKGGEDVTASRNVVRLTRAARSMRSAQRKKCDWLTDLTGKSHENDVPFMTKALNDKLSARPCGAQAMTYMKAGNFMKAIDAYMATADECPKIDEPDFDEEAPIEDSIISSVDEGSILDQEETEENDAILLEQSLGGNSTDAASLLEEGIYALTIQQLALIIIGCFFIFIMPEFLPLVLVILPLVFLLNGPNKLLNQPAKKKR
eukprot:TRINITY_DN1849_c0_g2_i5.p1 TRINITY_DN1849_c0_g2~~TRINITY_DN1849_c0_g2_i5.p1  ORF type:complete len:257 (+),score=63.17 TRINITY_DN1849_c0_g2_i5:71-841(+)